MTTISAFVAAYRKAEYWWEALDRPIISICADKPRHVDECDVFAKIALVNRVYRTNLHMGTKNAEWKLAERFVREGVDRFIAGIARCGAFCRTTLTDVLDAHEQLVRITYRVTNRIENSFCSKYLSFHFPESVLIFDNFACRSAWNLTKSRLPRGLHSKNWNVEYAYHCEAVLLLLDALHADGIFKPNLKLVDNVLYGNREMA